MQLVNKHVLNEHEKEKQKEKQTHKADGKGAGAEAACALQSLFPNMVEPGSAWASPVKNV